MADMLHFSLVSPVRELFSGDVKQVDAPGVEGEFGVLPKHAPFMTVLKPGVVRIHEESGVTPVFVRGGFADVTPAGLTILAEEAIRLSDVDAAALDTEITKLRSDAADPGDETRRKRAAERLVYLEALRAAVS
ncbi:MAG: F0F1 ATP synthase subunit epsilon [Hyphomonadaceae bacterium]|jgi:F-type H+-transporting ATPase subunit epsilon|nr:F0F1 ATP synthase subunit epsilon [Hyphomonadaceae bacterium]